MAILKAAVMDLAITYDGISKRHSNLVDTAGNAAEPTRFADDITGSNMGDEIHSGAGGDTVYGYDGNDLIYAGAGDDWLYGGIGNDTIHADAGEDRVYGEDGDDFISGGSGADELHGDAGHDNLRGGGDNDILHGGTGRDVLAGQGGDDILMGGNDDDGLIGGAGSDKFLFTTGNDNDTIRDYVDGEDHILIQQFGGIEPDIERITETTKSGEVLHHALITYGQEGDLDTITVRNAYRPVEGTDGQISYVTDLEMSSTHFSDADFWCFS